MANVQTDSPAVLLHGKTTRSSNGYYYEGVRGQQLYRERNETYQKKQSPRQKWNSLAFSFAHKQIRILWSTQEQIDQVTQEWHAAMKIGPNNRPYPDAKGWKFAMLQVEWKLNNPFETWYEQYLAEISQKAAEKTSSEDVSDYMLRHQAEILEAQAAELRAQLKARHSPN